MESKKINQLATELAPDLSDLTIIGDPTTGISKKITLSQMASLFTGTVEEYANFAAFPLVGVADTIYIALDTNILYRWNTGTSAYVELSPNIVSSLVFNDANGFDGTINLVGSVATLTITTALTTGSVGFIGASGALLQDNANFFWDDTNNRLGLGTNAPTTALDVFGSGIIGRLNGTSTNNAFLGFASAGSNKWSIGNVQSDNRFRIYNEATTSELVSVLSTGEFGIGIANPLTKLHIDGGASALIANLDANVSVAKTLSFRSDNSNRINLEVSGTESGSNAGMDFFIRRYSDAGALIDTPLTITRSTGGATFSGILTTPQVKAATSAGLSINANSGTQVADFGAGGSANMTLFGGLSGTSATFSGNVDVNNGSVLTAISTLGTVFTAIQSDNTSGYLGTNSNHPLVLRTNSTSRLTISSTGNVLIGTSTFDNGNFSSGASGLNIFAAEPISLLKESSTSRTFYMALSGNAFIGTKDAIAIAFLTSDAERMRITSGGFIGFGVTPNRPVVASYSVSGSVMEIINTRNSSSNDYALVTGLGSNANNTSSYHYIASTGGADKYYLYGNGTYTTVSDERLKKNITKVTDTYLDKVLGLNIVNYNWNEQEDGSPLEFGMIAQDVEKVIPSIVHEGREQEDGNVYKGIQASVLPYILIKAIQEQQAQIEELKILITAK